MPPSDDRSCLIVDAFAPVFNPRGCQIKWQRAVTAGAAAQRNQCFTQVTQPLIWSSDDDILLEFFCSASSLGGPQGRILGWEACAQCYDHKSALPVRRGVISRINVSGSWRESRCLPMRGASLGQRSIFCRKTRPDPLAVVPVEWLNTTCTLYRRAALPSPPPFSSRFEGYSLMEDVFSVR